MSRSLSILLLALCLYAAPAAAQDPEPDDGEAADPEPSPEPAPYGNSTEPQSAATRRCRPADLAPLDPNRPTGAWVIIDPDGCFRKTVYHLLGLPPPL